MRDLFKEVCGRLENACDFSDIRGTVYEELSNPDRILSVNFPVKLDNGETKTFTGYRCQYDGILGPYKGGIRYHSDVNQEEILGLASLMTWKTALMKLPFGGAKGGVNCRPKELTKNDLESITRKFTRKIRSLIGPEKDIPAPDINTDSQIMAYMMDEYSKIKGYTVPGVVTGKPISIGGIKGREKATGFGLSVAFELFMDHFGKNIKDSTVAIQGFGNVGKACAEFLNKRGASIVGVSDSSGGIYDSNGLDIGELIEFKKENQLNNYEEASSLSNTELLELDVDVLIPAALENAINKEIASKTEAKVIIEGANGPTTTEAEEVLKEREISVLPDIFGNSGGVIASYLEWVQNLQFYSLRQKEVRSEIKDRMKDVFKEIVDKKKKNKEVIYRKICYALVLERLDEVYSVRRNL